MALALLGNDGTNVSCGARVDVTGSCGFGAEELARGGRVRIKIPALSLQETERQGRGTRIGLFTTRPAP
jgi:hypothetical protein